MTIQPLPPLPPCDCLNDCGDDDRIHRGKATPCQHYLDAIVRAKEARRAQYLVLKDEFGSEPT